MSPGVVARRHELRARFQAPEPLTGFAVVPDFLSEDWLGAARAGCLAAEYATFCGYTPTGDPADLRDEFFEPVEDYTYVTIHQRPVRPVAELVALRAAFERPETLRALSEMTGVELRAMAFPPVLTAWGRGTFLEAHTDAGPPARPTRLLISISLTDGWKPDYGGTTVWAWKGETPVRMTPQANQAVLFAPSSRTHHWVERVAGHAPPRARFTWTLYFV